jgi:hypothetical protein
MSMAPESLRPRPPINWKAKLYIGFITACGVACLVSADWDMQHFFRFFCYLMVCLLASGMKVNLPGILGTLSVNFLFILIGILDMSAGQTLAVGCLGALVQCVWKTKSGFRPVQAMFSVMNMAIAVYASYSLYHWHFDRVDCGFADIFPAEHDGRRGRCRSD